MTEVTEVTAGDGIVRPADVPTEQRRDGSASAGAGDLVHLIRVAGASACFLFVVLAVVFETHLFGDGAMFSYAIALGESWTYHWHNIPIRLTPYLVAHVPAETFLRLTGNGAGAIALYGALFAAAPLVCLGLTWMADRTAGRIIFTSAASANVLLLPFVFGFPTEMWFAAALFWPTFALAIRPAGGAGSAVLTGLTMTLLVLSHEGGVVFGAFIVAAAVFTCRRGPAWRAGIAFTLAMAVWITVAKVSPIDPYFATVLERAKWHFLDARVLGAPTVVSVIGAVAGFSVLAATARWAGCSVRLAVNSAATVAGGAIIAYWLLVDAPIHAEQRYDLRTLLFLGVLALGCVAAVWIKGTHSQHPIVAMAREILQRLVRDRVMSRLVAASLGLVVFVQAGETVRFLVAWSQYKTDIRALAAIPTEADEPHDFVSVRRLPEQRLGPLWLSTTHVLSVLVSDAHDPQRLVVDPWAGYFWIGCRLATTTSQGARAIPAKARDLVRTYECRHRD